MSLTGYPQFLGASYVAGSNTYAWSGLGTATEVDQKFLNGQDQLAIAVTGFLQTNATHTISAGPTTAGPVVVGLNGTFWALPFNQAAVAPVGVWTALAGGPTASTWKY